jgi:hypothetical protein
MRSMDENGGEKVGRRHSPTINDNFSFLYRWAGNDADAGRGFDRCESSEMQVKPVCIVALRNQLQEQRVAAASEYYAIPLCRDDPLIVNLTVPAV